MASELGLSDAIVESYLPEYGSYVDLILAALRHRKCISSYAPELVTQKSAFQTNFKVAGQYIVCQTPCSSDSSTTIEIKRMYDDGSLVTLHSYTDLSSRLKLHFGPFASSANEFVCWGNYHIGWVMWKDPQLASNSPSCKRRRLTESEPARGADTDTGLHVWSTNEVASYSKTSAACPSCGMIAILTLPTCNQEGSACVLFRKLSTRLSTINEVGECTLQLPRNLTAANVIGFDIFPRARESDHDVCSCHYLVAEYFVSPFITLHSMHLSAKASCHADCVLSTVQIPAKLELSSPSTLYFSSDGSVVVIVETFCAKQPYQYCVWEPGTERVTGAHLASVGLNGGSKFRAIGKLYSVLGGQDGFAVVTTYTGEVLLRVRNLYSYSYTSPPVDQTWLSTLNLAIPEHIPIATLYSTTKNESSVAAVIARRCNRKCVD